MQDTYQQAAQAWRFSLALTWASIGALVLVIAGVAVGWWIGG